MNLDRVVYPQDVEPNYKGYILIATYTLFAYDYLCTFDKEVNYLWLTPWHWGKILFFINRYLPFVEISMAVHIVRVLTTPEMCRNHYRAITWLMISGLVNAELILVLRTIAIWDRKKSITIVVITTYLVVATASLAATNLFFKSLVYIPVKVYRYGCEVGTSNSIIIVAFIALLALETVIFVLTVVRATQHLRRSHSSWVVQLYKRGIMFYVYLFVLMLANVVFPVVVEPGKKAVFADLQFSLHSVLCNRVIFHILKQANTKQNSEAAYTSTYDSQVFTTIMDTVDISED
ncbi:hypothetical protein BDQ17DRAFT_1538766 [Cyathus striatus]|nr:hypothetical protein BDQ17DRAFT_1538766 [Cyathus striatus]